MPPTLREVAILCVAVHWRAQYEWWAHVRIARKEGLDETVINAILTGEKPTETELGVQAVTAFARETLDDKRVTDATFADAMARLGERGVVDLTTLLGYYCMVSASLNVFQVPVPKGEMPPFME
jgi:4-carboxymuconolactone decarboxylase